jgi:transcriptional regulator with XRE-family HTH domain
VARKKGGFLPDVGTRIRQVRLALGLSQRELGRRIGKTASAVSKYERGKINEITVLAALANVLGKSIDWLLYGHAPQPATEIPASNQLDEHTRELVALLQPQAGIDPMRSLPARYRTRYRDRIKELVVRVRRELDECRKVLEAEYRGERARRRHPT